MASRLLSTTLITPPANVNKSSSGLTGRVRLRKGRLSIRAVSGSSQGGSVDGTVYKGVYGPWTVEQSDVKEVILYRSGLVTAAASFVAASSAAFLPENSWLSEIIKQNQDLFYLVGAGGLGLSLFLIHIYVTEIKRTLQALWALGVVGSLAAYAALARPDSDSLVQYVVDHPTAVWFVGPLFASLTGLVFKEGLCYGKLEAGLLTFIIPSVLLGHLSGLMNDEAKLVLLGTWMALFVVFAGRKFTQPIKDDIGDKSVFMFMALPEDEKKAVVAKLEQDNSG
ncbi:hypothetical protein BRARA_I02969 [Brassica rapa]|uniref:BnaA09g27510D protein n=2 Tax=Brassica TaxID=3705 RepID=A0A078IBB3_BRANA|nr:uncharacterized protein LOC111200961 isoform X2 [Brassica napus]XP_033135133.1 uncharacterized protein LOC103838985 [Brassica rapa]XP_048596075.1 uncharacterized protein LOC111200961 isoform X3 [Brassica napus]RID46297.1 hypothetical protein BRARA_I02969 [Brassica rapa]CDY46624.1 BnaA09g27510D [Brassica napus]